MSLSATHRTQRSARSVQSGQHPRQEFHACEDGAPARSSRGERRALSEPARYCRPGGAIGGACDEDGARRNAGACAGGILNGILAVLSRRWVFDLMDDRVRCVNDSPLADTPANQIKRAWALVLPFPQRSPPWLLTTAACSGLRSVPTSGLQGPIFISRTVGHRRLDRR